MPEPKYIDLGEIPEELRRVLPLLLAEIDRTLDRQWIYDLWDGTFADDA